MLVVSGFAFTLLLIAISLVLADVTYTYDKDGRLTQVCNGSGQAATYVYDPDGNITQIADTASPGTVSPLVTQNSLTAIPDQPGPAIGEQFTELSSGRERSMQ